MEYLVKIIKDDNDYLSLLATDYLFKDFSNEKIQQYVIEELKIHKIGGPYSIARFENTFQNMINYNFVLQENDLSIIDNISLEDFIRLNVVFRYLQNTNLSKTFIIGYIDKYLIKLDKINSIENVDTLINLYNLIKIKGTEKQMHRLKNKLKLINMNELLIYLESNLYTKTLQ